jgi:hypothetical protein
MKNAIRNLLVSSKIISGERQLASALTKFETLNGKLEAAEVQMQDEIFACAEANDKLREKISINRARMEGLRESINKARRVSVRITEFLS